MSLAPTAAVTLGGRRYDAHAHDVRVALRLLPAVNAFTVTLPAEAQLDAVVGDPAVLELDGGEGSETVLTGKVRALRRGLRATRAIGADGGAELAALRPSATYERQDAKAVIRALAADSGVDIGRIDVDLKLVAYAAHQRRTAAEHVSALATLAGANATFDADGALNVAAPAAAPGVALRHGREIVACELDGWQPSAASVPIGFGAAGSVEAPGALRHTNEPLPANAPAAGADGVRRNAALLRTATGAAAAGAAAATGHGAAATRLRARCFLLPALRPGDVLELQDPPGGLEGGPWLVTAVSHRLTPREGGVTFFEARGATGGAGALLAAAGALGGLL